MTPANALLTGVLGGAVAFVAARAATKSGRAIPERVVTGGGAYRSRELELGRGASPIVRRAEAVARATVAVSIVQSLLVALEILFVQKVHMGRYGVCDPATCETTAIAFGAGGVAVR